MAVDGSVPAGGAAARGTGRGRRSRCVDTWKPWSCRVGHVDVAEVGVHVDAPSPQRVAHEVVVGVEVRVEPGRPGAEVELVELTHGGQVVEGLVHGAQRDGGHLGRAPRS